MSGSRWLNFALLLIAFVLGTFLLKENQRANAAEAKLDDIQNKMSAVNDENQNLINELQYQVTTLKAGLEEEKGRYEALTLEKKNEIQKLVDDAKAKEEEHAALIHSKESEIQDFENQAKEEKTKFSNILKDKNIQIQELTKKLEEASSEQVELIKKLQNAEAKNLDNESEINDLKRQVAKLSAENSRLEQALKAALDHPAALD